jgi:hypothetical protein
MTTRTNGRRGNGREVAEVPLRRAGTARRELLHKTTRSQRSAARQHIPGFNPDATPC